MDPSQHLAPGRRQPRPPRASATQAAVGGKALRWGLEGHGPGTEWRRKALRTQVWRKEVTRWPARAEAGERWVWAEVWRSLAGSEAHRPALSACHTSFGFIAFVQHPIVWFPFVPLSAPLPFISQPAWLFSFLLSEVPERKVLFSAV